MTYITIDRAYKIDSEPIWAVVGVLGKTFPSHRALEGNVFFCSKKFLLRGYNAKRSDLQADAYGVRGGLRPVFRFGAAEPENRRSPQILECIYQKAPNGVRVYARACTKESENPGKVPEGAQDFLRFAGTKNSRGGAEFHYLAIKKQTAVSVWGVWGVTPHVVVSCEHNQRKKTLCDTNLMRIRLRAFWGEWGGLPRMDGVMGVGYNLTKGWDVRSCACTL